MKEIINTSYVYKNGTVFATGNTVVTVVDDPAVIKLPPCIPCFPFSINTRSVRGSAFCNPFKCLFRCFR